VTGRPVTFITAVAVSLAHRAQILLDLEELDDKDLEAIRQDYERLAEEGRSAAHKRSPRAAAKPKKASPKKRSDS
jgi:hypothetical protein